MRLELPTAIKGPNFLCNLMAPNHHIICLFADWTFWPIKSAQVDREAEKST